MTEPNMCRVDVGGVPCGEQEPCDEHSAPAEWEVRAAPEMPEEELQRCCDRGVQHRATLDALETLLLRWTERSCEASNLAAACLELMHATPAPAATAEPENPEADERHAKAVIAALQTRVAELESALKQAPYQAFLNEQRSHAGTRVRYAAEVSAHSETRRGLEKRLGEIGDAQTRIAQAVAALQNVNRYERADDFAYGVLAILKGES